MHWAEPQNESRRFHNGSIDSDRPISRYEELKTINPHTVHIDMHSVPEVQARPHEAWFTVYHSIEPASSSFIIHSGPQPFQEVQYNRRHQGAEAGPPSPHHHDHPCVSKFLVAVGSGVKKLNPLLLYHVGVVPLGGEGFEVRLSVGGVAPDRVGPITSKDEMTSSLP
jgi:hypothetical protein